VKCDFDESEESPNRPPSATLFKVPNELYCVLESEKDVYYRFLLQKAENCQQAITNKSSIPVIQKSFQEYVEIVKSHFTKNNFGVKCKDWLEGKLDPGDFDPLFDITDDVFDFILTSSKNLKISQEAQTKSITSNLQQLDLNEEFFLFYKLIVQIWFNEYIRNTDLDSLTPCRIILLSSIIKRRFQEELVITLSNKKQSDD
jgi:hypothetical protein